MFFFGGAWAQGMVTQFTPQARHFAERGMVAIVADYRVFRRHGTTAFEAMADARSAIRWVRVLHGKADATVPFADVERFCAAATERGNQCQLVGYEGAAHGFFNPQVAEGQWHRETLLEADRFLTRLGYLTPGTAAGRRPT